MGAALVLEVFNKIGNQMTQREIILRKFFEEIYGFEYVVQRNWESLPFDYAVNGHDDLDLFVSDIEKPNIQRILKEKYPEILCDVRSPEDDYYPMNLSVLLLANRVEQDGFYIPNPMAAFFAIYYHNLVHKQDGPYDNKLKDMFKEMFPPVRCKDRGVGFYDNY